MLQVGPDTTCDACSAYQTGDSYNSVNEKAQNTQQDLASLMTEQPGVRVYWKKGSFCKFEPLIKLACNDPSLFHLGVDDLGDWGYNI